MPKQHLVSESAKTTTQIAIATMLDDDDRTAPAQLFWMLLIICQELALNRVLDAGDGEGFGAWRTVERRVRTEDKDKIRKTADVHLVVDT